MSYDTQYHRSVHASQLDQTLYSRQSLLHARLYLSQLKPADSVFEYGVGLGVNLFALQVAARLGFDISNFALDFCRQKGIPVTNRMEDVPRRSWDWVIARHILEHVPDPRGTLLLMRELLRDTGHLVAVIPEERWCQPPNLDSMDVNQHLFSWTPQTFANLLLQCGYRVDSMAREPLSMKTFLLRCGLISDPLYRVLVRTSDCFRFGTCPGELIVIARQA